MGHPSSEGAAPEGRPVDANGVRLHVLEFQPAGVSGDDASVSGRAGGEPKTVVFLHGAGPGNSAWANFRGNYRAFVDAGFRVVLPDLVGFGGSDKPTDKGDYTLDFFCDTLMAALDAVGVSNCAFVGNSLGGGVAIRIALEAPSFVEKLVLMGPGCLEPQADYFAMPGIAKMMDAAGAGIDEENLADVLRAFVYDPSHITDDLVAMRWAVARTQPKEVLSTMKTPALAPRLSELKCPLLTFWGADDAFMPPQGKEACLRANDRSRLVEVNACGHWVMIEHARMFNATAVDFLLNG